MVLKIMPTNKSKIMRRPRIFTQFLAISIIFFFSNFDSDTELRDRLNLHFFHRLRGRVQTTWTNEGEGVAQMTSTLK